MKAYKGNIVFTKNKDQFEIYKNHYLIVQEGIVKGIKEEISEFEGEVFDYSNHMIIPGLVDIHTHAPQFNNQGIGLDEELLPWLNQYTFKEEEKFQSLDYAKEVYNAFVQALIKNGTTHVVVFGSIHNESNKILINLLEEYGIKAIVGNVNMDQKCSPALMEETKASIEKTIELTAFNRKKALTPIVTPRFVPSCSKKLLRSLGDYVKKESLGVQTHMSENLDEISLVKEMYPWSKDYVDVYEKFNLINDKTIFAHCVHSSIREQRIIKNYEAYIAHCPTANFNLASGIMPLRTYLDSNQNIGLGSDVAAGHTLSIFGVMKAALQASKMKWFEDKSLKPVTTSEVFYLATKGGGSYFGKVGSFEKGYEFSALILKSGSNISYSIKDQLEKIIYTGDDRNIVCRIIGNRKF